MKIFENYFNAINEEDMMEDFSNAVDSIEQKLFSWHDCSNLNPEAFASSLSNEEIITLLQKMIMCPSSDDLIDEFDGSSNDFIYGYLVNKELDAEFTSEEKYTIVGEYIRRVLCGIILHSTDVFTINKWSALNLAFNCC